MRAFQRTGTRGAFNWYRAIDLNWEDARGIPDPTIRIPSLMITAENDLDPAPGRWPSRCARWIPGTAHELIRRCSHWTQQERPDEVNRCCSGSSPTSPPDAPGAARGFGSDTTARAPEPPTVERGRLRSGEFGGS